METMQNRNDRVYSNQNLFLKNFFRILLVMLLMVIIPQKVMANLVVNGSFEDDDFTDTAVYANANGEGAFIGTSYNTDTLIGWSYTVNLDGWTDTGVRWADAQDGNQYLDITGNTRVLDVNGSLVPVPENVLTQIVTTVVGRTYNYSFYWGEDVGHVAGESVELNSTVLDSNGGVILYTPLSKTAVGPVGGLNGPNTWEYFETTFVATTTQTTLSFTVTADSVDTGAGADLDNVKLIELLDTDNDGIVDITDLDDDNDGILDTNERDPFVCTNVPSPVFGAAQGPNAMNGSNPSSPNVGDQFRYSGVYAGVDAIVTVVSATGGEILTLLDNTGMGSDTHFQPSITHSGGSIEFSIQFVNTGTLVSAPTIDMFLTAVDNDNTEFIAFDESIQSSHLDTPTVLSAYVGAGGSYSDGYIGNGSNISGVSVTDTEVAASGFYNDINVFKFRLGSTSNITSNHSVTFNPCVPLDNWNTPPTSPSVDRDSDNDSVPDHLDVDSDNDNCPDAVEGGAGFTFNNIDLNKSLTGAVDANGVPTLAGATGQTIGTSDDNTTQSLECDSCNVASTLFVDTDGDTIGDVCDLDDDNDGILDTQECIIDTFGQGGRSPLTGSATTTYTYQPLEQPAGSINDGFYGVLSDLSTGATYAKPQGTAWEITSDHTGDVNGRMAVFNAANPGDISYQRNIKVIANKDNNFSFWINNFYLESGTQPNLTIEFRTLANVLISSSNTGDIAEDQTWREYTFNFNPGNETEIQFIIINNQTSGGGNDFAIDDLSLLTCDTDLDGIQDSYDLDSDNDGIPDNVEAQTTQNYIAPNNIYDANGTDTAYVSGLIPVDTDEDNITDVLDTDSDDDNITDCEENNDAISSCEVNASDVGTNGLVSWAESTDDYTDTNGLAHNGTNFILDDTDDDTLADGTDASPTATDLDYRDDVIPVNNPPLATDINHTIDTAGTQELDLLALITDVDGIVGLFVQSINDVNLIGGEQNISVPNGEIRIDAIDVITFVPDVGFTGDVSFEYVGTDGTDTVVANVNITVTSDTDGDGIIDSIDLDDDNDGILDVEEGCKGGYTGSGYTEFTPYTLTQASNTFTDSGQAFGLGDTALYTNVGSYLGQGFDVLLTVTRIKSPEPDFVDISGNTFGGLYFPVYMEGSPSDSAASFSIEFFETGTSMPIKINAALGVKDIDSTNPGEGLEFLKSDLYAYTFAATTDLFATQTAVSDYGDAGDYITFKSTVADNNFLDNLWVRAEVGYVNSFNFTLYDRDGNTGYTLTPMSIPTQDINVLGCPDTDGDNIVNSLDLDSDNDGIPDNVEAQTTQNYQEPSGGVDGNGTYAIYGLTGITPVNTDGTDEVDYLDTDSDNDGIFDILESGQALANDGNGTTTVVVGVNGLANTVESADDYNDTNGLAYENIFTLDDTDNDTAADGTDASPTTTDLDYRDDVTLVNSPPVAVDLNHTISIGNSINLALLTGSSDSEGDTLNISSINGTAILGGEQNITVPNGMVMIASDGNMTFVPDNGYIGDITFAYELSDGSDTGGANVNISITDVCNLIPAGSPTAPLTSADVSFDITGVGGAFGNAILNSITVSGEANPFSELIGPDSIAYSFTNPSATGQYINDHGVITETIMDGSAIFDPAVLSAMNDRDLNHFLAADPGSTGGMVIGDYVDFKYNTPIKAAGNRYFMVTERGGNNGLQVIALDINGDPIGGGGTADIVSASATYINTGVSITTHPLNTTLNGTGVQPLDVAIFPLTAVASRGEEIYGLRLIYNQTSDGGDAKIFVMVDPSSICTITAQNDDFSSTPINPLTGGTTASIFDDNGNGTDLADGVDANDTNIDDGINIVDDGNLIGVSISSTGVLTVPTGLAEGTYDVKYQICLASSSAICDTAIARIKLEIPLDTDGDGLIDSIDLDDDNDGVLDSDEGCSASPYNQNIQQETSGTSGNSFALANPFVFNAGNNRVLLVAVGMEANSANEPITVKYGNTVLQELNTRVVDNTSIINMLNVYYLTEAQILAEANALTTGEVISVTIDDVSKSGEIAINAISLSNIDQTQLAFSNINENSVTGNPYVFPTVAAVEGDYLFRYVANGVGSDDGDEYTFSSGNEIVDLGWGGSSLGASLTVIPSDGNYDEQVTADLERRTISQTFILKPATNTTQICIGDTDNDTILDYLDRDSDGDSCEDAIEGAGVFTASDLDANGSLTGGVDANGIPLVAGVGQASTLALLDENNSSACASNNPPLAVDSNHTIDTASTQELDLLALITDADGLVGLSVQSINDVNLTGGEQNITVPNGEIRIDASDVITFIPNVGFTGDVSFEYVGTDGTDTVVANVNITVTSDRDGDGVIDSIDLDDDNDGILDVNEFKVCEAGIPLVWDAGSNGDLSRGFTSNSGITGTVVTTLGTGGASVGLPTYVDGSTQIDIQSRANIATENEQSVITFSEAVTMDEFNVRSIVDLGAYNESQNIKFYLAGKEIKFPASIYDQNGGTIVGASFDLATGDANGSTVAPEASFRFTINEPIDQIVISQQANATADNIGFRITSVCGAYRDTDNDGLKDHLDLDSDNDGIPDNVEAQTTQNYVAPNGAIDVNGTYSAIYGLTGLTPVNTDGNDTADYIDLDSDNDGIFDIVESGQGLNSDVNGSTTDPVGVNGLANAVESTDDYNDTNGLAHDGTNFTLDDSDSDTDANGSNATPMSVDLDYRDNLNIILGTNDANNSVNGFTGGSNVLNVLTGDTLNGVPVTISDVNITFNNSSILDVDPITGNVSVPVGTQAGDYSATYTICEIANPSNCVTRDVNVTVDAAPIDAIDDDFSASPVNGLEGGVAGDITTTGNDTLNGVDVNDSFITLSIVTADTNLSGVSVDNNGSLNVPAGVMAGTYNVAYELCEVLNPTNCDEANVTVVVEPAVLVGTIDTNTSVNGLEGGSVITDVTLNDTLNGSSFTLGSDVNITAVTTTTAYLEINTTTGEATVAANTPEGNYTETYTICENLNPTNCADVNVTVEVVPAVIDAVDDSFIAGVNGLVGGIVGDITGNDTLNSVSVDDNDINITLTGDTNLTTSVTVDENGTLEIAGNTPAGEYYVEYETCEVLNPTNCDEANISVEVTAAPIDGNNDSNDSVNGSNGGLVLEDITENDTINGNPVTLGIDANITNVTNNTALIIDPITGSVTLPAQTVAGIYTETYTLCEILNPSNCIERNVTVTVEAAPIDAVDDDFSSVIILNTIGGTAGDVTESGNDTLNAMDVNDSLITLEIVETESNLTSVTLENNGTLTVDANTSAGTYNVTYRLCEILNPTSCDEANVTIVVLQDTDGDGIANIYDLDDDNDGITDLVELDGNATRDTDSDGIIDSLDLDSDNDGLLDLLESGQDVSSVDTDGNGVLDSTTDADNDGLMDVADLDDNDVNSEGNVVPVDTDSDGMRDFQDVDSDNDGLTDLVEGIIDASNDSDNDGRIDENGTTNVDENGVPTAVSSVTTPVDTDTDSVPDYRDLDSDNDGLNDVEEGGGVDVDGDGLDDTPNTSFIDPTTVPDSDNDGTLDPLEPNNPQLAIEIDENADGVIDDATDTDGDGIPNITDGTPTIFGTTPALDSDNDGIADAYDLDDDNDGITDEVEEQGNTDLDTDGDGILDRLDLDSDNDGILDLLESGQDPESVDTNNDGVLDSTTDDDNDGLMDSADVDDTDPVSLGTVTPIDTDGDGKRDFQDVDSDNDGLGDMVEVGIPTDNDEDNNGMIDGEVDENGIPTVVSSVITPVNTDNDSVPDYRDLDSDNDGLTDVDEVGGLDEDRDGIVDVEDSLVDGGSIPDSDGDNIPDVLEPNNDNLPVVLDSDADGIIDDNTDTDNDGIPDVTDGKDTIYGTGPSIDSDGDGIADEYDIDDDNDGIPDTVEDKGNVNRDTDLDGVIDSLDLDSDNDGMLDILEAGGVDSNNDGRVDASTDTDKDGLADIVDVSPTTANNPINENSGRLVTLLLVPDTDNDGKDDFQDVDSDNDGLSDLVEAGTPVSNDEDNDGMIDGEVDENGIPSTTTPISNPLDSDEDGRPDYRELDSDNDGRNDIIEAGGEDEDSNGLVDTSNTFISITNLPDSDEDGVPDYREFNAQLIADVVSNIVIGEAAIIEVLNNDELSGYDRETLQIIGTQSPGESLVVANEGTWSITSDNEIVFTPEEGVAIDPSDIRYSLENNNGERIETASVTVNYESIVRPDNRVTDLSEPVTVEVLANDNGNLDSSTVEIELPDGFVETHPSAVLSEDARELVVPGEGTWMVNNDGTITYRAEVGIPIVDPTPISYSVADTNGQRLETDATIVLNQSVVAEQTDTNETCETYEENNVVLNDNWNLFLMILLSSLLGMFLFRREKL